MFQPSTVPASIASVKWSKALATARQLSQVLAICSETPKKDADVGFNYV